MQIPLWGQHINKRQTEMEQLRAPCCGRCPPQKNKTAAAQQGLLPGRCHGWHPKRASCQVYDYHELEPNLSHAMWLARVSRSPCRVPWLPCAGPAHGPPLSHATWLARMCSTLRQALQSAPGLANALVHAIEMGHELLPSNQACLPPCKGQHEHTYAPHVWW